MMLLLIIYKTYYLVSYFIIMFMLKFIRFMEYYDYFDYYDFDYIYAK